MSPGAGGRARCQSSTTRPMPEQKRWLASELARVFLVQLQKLRIPLSKQICRFLSSVHCRVWRIPAWGKIGLAMAAPLDRETTLAFCLALRHRSKRSDDVDGVFRRGPGRVDVAGTRPLPGPDSDTYRETETQPNKAQPTLHRARFQSHTVCSRPLPGHCPCV